MNTPATPVNQPILNNVRVPLAPIRLNVTARPFEQQLFQEDGIENGPDVLAGSATRFFMNQFLQIEQPDTQPPTPNELNLPGLPDDE